MRIFELDKTTDDPTVEEIANAIASDCVPFLKAAGGQMLLRGLEWQHGKEMINDSLYHFALTFCRSFIHNSPIKVSNR